MSKQETGETTYQAWAYAAQNSAGRPPGLNVASETETPDDIIFDDLAEYDGLVGPASSRVIDVTTADSVLERLGFRRLTEWTESRHSSNMPRSGQWFCDVEPKGADSAETAPAPVAECINCGWSADAGLSHDEYVTANRMKAWLCERRDGIIMPPRPGNADPVFGEDGTVVGYVARS